MTKDNCSIYISKNINRTSSINAMCINVTPRVIILQMCVLFTLLEVERISSVHMIYLGPYIATIANRVFSVDN